MVKEDVAEGYVTPAAAAALYGKPRSQSGPS